MGTVIYSSESYGLEIVSTFRESFKIESRYYSNWKQKPDSAKQCLSMSMAASRARRDDWKLTGGKIFEKDI